jgi:hypothetical protein
MRIQGDEAVRVDRSPATRRPLVTKHLRTSLMTLCALLIAGAAAAGPQPESDPGPQRFGAPVTVKKAVNIARLVKDPGRFAGRTVRLEGTVKEVCQGRGCWVEVESGGASFLARGLDESVLLPKDCKGRRVVVQGVVKALPRATQEEPVEAGHTCPKPEWIVATEGAILK